MLPIWSTGSNKTIVKSRSDTTMIKYPYCSMRGCKQDARFIDNQNLNVCPAHANEQTLRFTLTPEFELKLIEPKPLSNLFNSIRKQEQSNNALKLMSGTK